MSEFLRWGVLGASKFALGHMAPAIHMAKGAEFAAIATSSKEKAAPFQAFQPNLRVFEDYDALLADDAIDAIYIPLPNHLHVAYTLKALEAGKHVLCEKPIAMESSQIDALIEARDRTGLLAAEAYMIVHHPQWQRAKHLVNDGAVGTLSHVQGVFSFNNAADTQNIRNDASKGGGAIPDIGVYTYGSTRWATGEEPDAITLADLTFENGVDVTARVAARFPSCSAMWTNSMRMHPAQEMLFMGDEGAVRLTAPFNANVFDVARIEIHQPNLGVRVERFPTDNHYVHQVEAFGRSVLSGTPYPWTLEDAKGTQAMIDRIYAAAKEGT